MKEYKIAKGWAIFIYIFAPLLIALFAWLMVMPFIEENMPVEAAIIIIPISIGMIGLSILGFLDARNGKVIIGKNSVKPIGPLSTKELVFRDIKGYTNDGKYIYIVPISKDKKKIKIIRIRKTSRNSR